MATNKLCCQDSQLRSHTAIEVYIEKYKSDYVTPLVLSRSFPLLLRYNADILLWPPPPGPLWLWFLFASLILLPTLLVFPTLCGPATLASLCSLMCHSLLFLLHRILLPPIFSWLAPVFRSQPVCHLLRESLPKHPV